MKNAYTAACVWALACALGLPVSVSGDERVESRLSEDSGQEARAASQQLPPPTRTSLGILSLEVTPDSIATIRVAQGVITRVALPEEAKTAICGDLFDPATNTGSFVIEKNGRDVFIKPVASKSQSNLFIKTESNVYAFDLIVVPSAQAYRVVNVNQPSYREQLEAERQQMLAEVDATRRNLESAMNQQLEARRRELEREAASGLDAERKRLRAEADRRAGEFATRRLADGIMQGLNGVPLVERRGRLDQIQVDLGDIAYTFEGKLYVPYRITNGGSGDLTYREPRVLVRGTGQDADRVVQAETYTSRGEYRVGAGESATGVVVFERPSLQPGQRVLFLIRADGGSNRALYLRLLE